MTDKNKKYGFTAPTTVTDASPQPGAGATSVDGLSPIEEKALRMLHGLSEDDDHELSFALGANEETRLKLAMMEKHLLDAFQWGELTTFEIGEQHVDAKAKIINRLRDKE